MIRAVLGASRSTSAHTALSSGKSRASGTPFPTSEAEVSPAIPATCYRTGPSRSRPAQPVRTSGWICVVAWPPIAASSACPCRARNGSGIRGVFGKFSHRYRVPGCNGMQEGVRHDLDKYDAASRCPLSPPNAKLATNVAAAHVADQVTDWLWLIGPFSGELHRHTVFLQSMTRVRAPAVTDTVAPRGSPSGQGMRRVTDRG